MNTPREQLTQESQAERGGRRLAQLTVRAPSGSKPQIRPGERAPRYPMCPGTDESPLQVIDAAIGTREAQRVRDTREAVCERGPGG
jgi:hypothetical protein